MSWEQEIIKHAEQARDEFIKSKRDLGNNSQYTPSIEISRVFKPILAKDLKTLATVDISWVVEGVLAKNYLTLFAAREKMGKTTLIRTLIKSLVTGDDFVGLSVKKARVLYISEENVGLWDRRMEDMGLTDCETIWFLPQPFNTRLKLKAWELFLIEDVAKFCEENQIEVLILDTISPIWPVLNENDAAEVQTALLPLTSITKKGVAVLPLHHYSKAGGIRGSTVLGAVPDILLDFSKPQGDEETTRRVLKCRSRFEESPSQLLLDFKDGEYICLGTPQNVAKQEKLDQIKKQLEKHSNGAVIQELLDTWDDGKKPSRRMLQNYLNDLCIEHKVLPIGKRKIKGGEATIYSLYPCTDDDFQGLAVLTKTEANNPGNGDTKVDIKTGLAGVISKKYNEPKPCYMCGFTKYWKRADGQTVCTVCHPSVVQEKTQLVLAIPKRGEERPPF